jgi:hypothetical protein
MEATEKSCTSAKVSVDGDNNYAAIGIVRDIRKDMAGTLLLNLRGFHQAVTKIKRRYFDGEEIMFPYSARVFRISKRLRGTYEGN